ncbi:MAG: RcnB family protein [Ramlibacter sp.]
MMMKLKPSTVFVLALAAATAAPAFAQGDGDPAAREQNDRMLRQAQRQRGLGNLPSAVNDPQRNYRAEARGARPERGWRRGDRLPQEYRHRNYVVDDWRGHHLRQPPRGYQWVQDGSDYILVAIATGIIAEVLLNGR